MANTNGGRINFQVGYNVDQNSVSQIKKSLQDLQNIKFSNFKQSFKGTTTQALKDFNEIKKVAGQVQAALDKAFNVNLNSLNSKTFMQDLNNMKGGIQGIYQTFSKAGTQGQIAFNNVTRSVLTTNLQLKETKTLVESMGQTMANTVKWGIASSVMNSFTNSVQQAFQYVKSLDSALTDIRIVTGDSTEQMAQFAIQANKAAQSLGRSTMDYSKAALTFYQQGLGDEDVQARTQATLKAQNITGAGQEMADYLTAVWNGYKVANEEAELYVDKLAAVADSSASNMSQLAIAMSKVASSANALGVPVDSLNAQIATIVATTRQAPESVGNALKTIYSRINDISTGAQDAQISLGNYSKKMLDVGVSVLDANGNLRDTGQVIEQIGGKWESLSREQQIYLARTMAGQRQYNNLIALFDNWSNYTNLVNVSLDSQGTLMEKNSRYMDSLTAHMEQLGAAGQRVKSDLIDEESIKNLVDFGTDAVNVFGSLIQSLGGGGQALLNFGAMFASLFSGTISKEINNIVVRIQDAKANADILKNDITATKTFAQSGIDSEGTKIITQKMQAMQQYYSVMDKESINAQKNLIDELGQLENQKIEINKNIEAVEQYAQKSLSINSKDLWDQEKAGIQAVSEALGTLQGSASNAKDVFSAYQNGTRSFDQMQKAIQGFINEYNKINPDKAKQLEQALSNLTTNSSQSEVASFVNILNNGLQDANSTAERYNNTLRTGQQEQQKLNQQTKNLSAVIDQNNKKAAQLFNINAITKFATGLAQIGMAVNNIRNLFKIWQDESLSTGQKILQTLTNVGFTITSMVNVIKGLKTVSEALTALSTKQLNQERLKTLQLKKQTIQYQKQKLIKLQDAFEDRTGVNVNDVVKGSYGQLRKKRKNGPVLASTNSSKTSLFDAIFKQRDTINQLEQQAQAGAKSITGTWQQGLSLVGKNIIGFITSPAGIATAAIVALGVAIYGVYKWWNKDAEAAQKAAKTVKETKQHYESLKDTLNNFNNSISSYDDSIQALNKLSKGTDQWNQKLKETNEQVLQLLQNYPQLANAISQNADGLLTIDKQSEAYKNYLQDLNKTVQTANVAQISAQQNSNQATRTSTITNLSREGSFSGLGWDGRQQLDKVITAIENRGQSILGNTDALKEVANLSDQEVKVIQDNSNKILTAVATIESNTKAIEIMSNTVAQDLLKDNSQYQNSEYQEDFAKIVGQELSNPKFNENLYSTILPRSSNRVEDTTAIANRYAEIIGQEVKKNFGSGYSVKNAQTGQWEKVTEDFVKNEIAAADALDNFDNIVKDTNDTINSVSKSFGDLTSAALKFKDVNSNEDLEKISFADMSLNDLLGLNPAKLRTEFDISKDIKLQQFLEKQAQIIKENTRRYINSLSPGVQDAFNNLDTSKMSDQLQRQVGQKLSQVFIASGGKGNALNPITDFYKDFEQNQLEAFLNIQDSIDYSSISVEDFTKILRNSGIQTKASTEQLQSFIDKMAEIKQAAEQLSSQQRYKTIQDIVNGLKKGDTISDQDKNTLESYGIDVQSFFKPLADGTWELKGRAEDFAKITNDISLQGLRDQIDSLQKKINQINQYTQEQLVQHVTTGQGASRVGRTDVINIQQGSQAQQLALQQIQFLQLIDAAEKESIANWRYAIQEKGKISIDQIQKIYELIEQNKDKIGNLSQEEVQRLKQLQEELYNSSQPSLDPDVDQNKYEALSDYLHEYGNQLDGVSEHVTAVQQDADDLAQAFLRYDSALGEVIQHYEDWEDILTNGSILQQAEAAQQLQNVYSDLLDLPYENLSPDFTTSIDNLHLLQQAANGSEQAYNALRAAALEDISTQVGLDTTDFYNESGALYNQYNTIQNELDDIEIGAYIDNAQAIQSMNQIINAADMTAQQATDLLASMGVDATVQQAQVPETQTQEVIGMNPVISRYPVSIPQILGDGSVSSSTYQIPRIDYQPIYSTATAQGSKTSTALRVTSAKKSSGGNLKFNMASNGAGTRGQAARTPKTSGGKKGGGGGKGSTPKLTTVEAKATPQRTKQKEADYDPYEQITKQQQRQDKILDNLEKAEKKLTGKERLENLKQQNKALEKQNDILQDRLVISENAAEKNTTAWYAKELQNAFGSAIGFNQDGQISDRNKAQAAAVAAYNAAVLKADKDYEAALARYNARVGQQITDAQKKQLQNQLKAAQDKKKKALDIAKEEYDGKTKLLDAYEKAWQADQKTREQIEKNLEQFYQNRIIQSKIIVDLKIDSGDFERNWLKFENKVIKKIKDNDFIGQAKANAKEIASYFNSGQIQALDGQINSIQREIGIMQAGGTSQIYGNNKAQAYEDLEKYMKQLQSNLSDIQDLVDDIGQNYLKAIDKANDKMKEQVDQYERVNKLIDHNVKMTQLLYGDKAYDTMDKYFEKRQQNDQAELESLRAYQQYWQQKMNNQTPGSQAWEEFKKNVDDYTDQVNSKLQDMIQSLSDKWQNRVDGIIQKMNNSLTSGLGLDYIDEQWDAINNFDDKFLDTVETRMGIQDVERQYQKAIDSVAGNPKAQQRINALMKDQLKILKEKDKLTQYDLDRAKAMLQVEQARMDLEDSRNNKTKMRLRRDSQGNYTYQYVADEQRLTDLQDALADAQSNLYNMDKEHYKQNLNDMYDTYKDYISKMKQLTAAYNATQDQEEKERIQKRIDLLKQSANKLWDSLDQDNKQTLRNLSGSFGDAMGIDLSTFSTEEQFNLLKDNVPQVASNIQNLADTILGQGGLLPATAQYMQQINQATKDYDADVKQILTTAGTSLDIIKNVTDTEGNFLDQNITKAKDLITTNEQLIKTIDDEISGIQQMLNYVEQYLQGVINIEQVLNHLRTGYNTSQQGNYDSDLKADSTIETTPNQIDTTQGNNFTGTVAYTGNDTMYQIEHEVADKQIQANKEDTNKIIQVTKTAATQQQQKEQQIYNDYLNHQTQREVDQDTLFTETMTDTYNIIDKVAEINNTKLQAINDLLDTVNVNLITSNILGIVRAFSDTGLNDVINTMSTNSNSQISPISDQLDQDVHIDASFPNVTTAEEIERAFTDLVNKASMFASRARQD